MKNRIRYCVLVMAVVFILNGCINLGPDYIQPDLGIQTPQSYEYAPLESDALIAGDRWWEVFGDKALNQLVDDVLKNNWDIKLFSATAVSRLLKYSKKAPFLLY